MISEPVAPGVEEIEERPLDHCVAPAALARLDDRAAVVDDEADVAALGTLSFLASVTRVMLIELVAHVDKTRCARPCRAR